MTYNFSPKGVCSRQMIIEVENGIIQNLEVIGGCDGNLKGIASLVQGQRVEDVIPRLEGIRCGNKTTSCPDQLSKALAAIAQEQPV
ncbi:MAG: TIGR03905 family TSCPD domain-containing protein [Oscillospiraceae bacterium]|nr:TIGR03905 family TSCPD domain-containing protein [Oscillospiraceae bacterium]